jgi:quinol monooxygenase YgiN
MVRFSVRLHGSGRSADRLVEAFRFVMVTTRLEPGCLNCAVWTDSEASVHYAEEWASEPDLRAHVRSEEFTMVLSIIESANEAPDVRFDFVTASRGLDYVTDVRQDLPTD